MEIKNIPKWLTGVSGGLGFGLLLWVLRDVPYVGIIPSLLGVGIAFLWKVISLHTIRPLFGYSVFSALDLYGTHRNLQIFFLIAFSTLIGTFIMAKRKILKIVGISLLTLVLLTTIVWVVVAMLMTT